MTLEDIYLEFRTAPVGGLSPASALSETLQFAGTRLSLSAATGWEIGTGINYLIETYDPSLGDAIGGTEAGMIDAARQAINEVQTGHYESAFDSLFGFPVTNSGDPFGDWGNSDPMMDYYGSGGGCGW